MTLTPEQKREIVNQYGYRAADYIRAAEICIYSGEIGRGSSTDRFLGLLEPVIYGALTYIDRVSTVPQNRIISLFDDLRESVRHRTELDASRAVRCLHMAMNDLLIRLEIPMPPEERLVETIFENGNK